MANPKIKDVLPEESGRGLVPLAPHQALINATKTRIVGVVNQINKHINKANAAKEPFDREYHHSQAIQKSQHLKVMQATLKQQEATLEQIKQKNIKIRMNYQAEKLLPAEIIAEWGSTIGPKKVGNSKKSK